MHINANNMLKNTAQNIIYTDKIYVRNHLYVLRLLGPHITWVDTSSTVVGHCKILQVTEVTLSHLSHCYAVQNHFQEDFKPHNSIVI